MKKLYFLSIISFLFVGCGEKDTEEEDLPKKSICECYKIKTELDNKEISILKENNSKKMKVFQLEKHLFNLDCHNQLHPTSRSGKMELIEKMKECKNSLQTQDPKDKNKNE